MFTHRSMHKTAALLMLAGAVVAAPSFAFADRDHGKHRRDRSERCEVDSRRGDRHDHRDRHDRRGHDRDIRWERDRRDRDCGSREVRHVVVRRPAPRFTVAVQFGQPSCAPAPVYYAPPPVCGAYYDPYCQARYSNFDVYVEHVSRSHGISVAIRN